MRVEGAIGVGVGRRLWWRIEGSEMGSVQGRSKKGYLTWILVKNAQGDTLRHVGDDKCGMDLYGDTWCEHASRIEGFVGRSRRMEYHWVVTA